MAKRNWANERARLGGAYDRDEEFSFLSFRFDDSFLEDFKTRTPAWGFAMGGGNYLGEYAFYTKYSRVKADGNKERFYECLRRVIEGMYSIQKDHALRNRLPWNEQQARLSAQEAYIRAFDGKWSPPGRGFWMMGTEFVNGRGDSSALQNCGFLSTKFISTEYAEPFVTLMNMSMLGVGVGFDTLGAGTIELHEPTPVNHPYQKPTIIEDSREGWCKATAQLLNSFFKPGKREVSFDFSDIRPAGSVIQGFGGTSAGPRPLKQLHRRLRSLLGMRRGQSITSTDIVDIMNMIGKCVVAANVRSSAEIALGDPYDSEFLQLKDWRVNPERMGYDGWGYTSNNSVIVRQGDDLSHLAEQIQLNGEPGIFWLDTIRTKGRMVDGWNEKDHRAMGVNPCGEQPLENHELCTLVETFPTKHSDLNDYVRTLKFAYLYGKSVTLLATQWPRTNEVMIRNRRIGTSMTGIAEFAEARGWAELKRWQNEGYAIIREWDETYSEWLGVRESIRVTTVKPSGTVSLLFGVTPGCHWPKERGYYVRTVRETVNSPVVEIMRRAGYRVEPNKMNPTMGVVIYLPVVGPDIRSDSEVSIWEKVSLAEHCQRYWSDNSVSVTASFDPKREGGEIDAILRAFDGRLKSLSFLPSEEGVYAQAPYQKVTQEEWQIMHNSIMPIDWAALYGEAIEPEGERFCSNDVCEVL
jgi:adenosylcobalamin-dependent ribonucleoside-triphosphate reductase